ncbi:MAG: DUF433 domain-containing protein [Phycisphaerae bacterium]|nr:DUF433 domain-containing protein [Phycisphaerae bacterium]
MAAVESYIDIDKHGVNRVAGTRISIDSIVIAFQQGDSAEEIQRNFPVVTLEQVYGTITYYLAHRHEVDDYLQQRRENWEQLRAKSERMPSAAIERLRQARAAKVGQAK